MNTFHFKSLVSLYILSRVIVGFFVQRPHVIRLEIFVWLHNQVIHDGWSQSCWTIGIISDLQHKKWELMSKQSIRRGVDPGRKRSNMLWFATRPFLVLFLHSRVLNVVLLIFFSCNTSSKIPKPKDNDTPWAANGEIVQNRKILQQPWEQWGQQKPWEDG